METDKEKTEKRMEYDPRKKELVLNTVTTMPLMEGEKEIGQYRAEARATYGKEGMIALKKDWERQKKNAEIRIGDIERSIKDTPEMTPELQVLKDQLTALQKIDRLEKQQEALKTAKKELKDVEDNLDELKSKVGNNLNLEEK